ncbi:MAG: phosphodiester glycosidase family protein [Clostridia bacterium]|nr:phosphodiester glycosidase family protein [Clostridia bacterium]
MKRSGEREAKLAALLLMTLWCALALSSALSEGAGPITWTQKGAKVTRRFESDTLCFTIQKTGIKTSTVYVTTVWMKDPGQQIRKVNAQWGAHLALPETLAKRVPEAALVINGSGYISRTYPEIPDDYPGKSEDYFFTSWGSLVMTDGEILRNLEDVPFYGIALNEEGLSMYAGELPEEVLASGTVSTWSFYDGCALIRDHEIIVDYAWEFADHLATRTILAKADHQNYVILTATNTKGLRLSTAAEFLKENFDPQWAFNLDGGPSSALLAWRKGTKRLVRVFGGERKDFDILCFCVDE